MISHLKGLDGYRAIAALSVLVGHIELFKHGHHLKNFSSTDFFTHTGADVAVVLFFALSGFLITLLLLKEKENYNTISLKKFYLRRIFRVWPLYYLILIVSALVLNYTPSTATLLLSLTIFPNIAYALCIPWAVSPIIWSIGVEEQFYLFWPIIVKKMKNNILYFLICFFIIYSTFPMSIIYIADLLNINIENKNLWYGIFKVLKFNCMAAGAIFALLYHQKNKVVQYLQANALITNFLILLPFVLWYLGVHTVYFTYELYAFLFSISILNISTAKNVKINIENKLFKFLGKISYGIYMYHWIILSLIFKYYLPYLKQETILTSILLYVIVILLTVSIATISYYYFEKPFLRLKEKYNT